MSSGGDITLPAMRRTRKSIGAATYLQKPVDKENATIDTGGTMLAANRKKSRSKSMGPGGLDALKQGTGNRRASLAAPARPPRSILKPTITALPEIPPLKKSGQPSSFNSRTSNSTLSTSGDDSSGSKIALRTEEEQQIAARAREEQERRDARRKSLANRRVSFAAEATLHTFHEIEYMQDATSSTDSTRTTSGAKSLGDTLTKDDQPVAQSRAEHGGASPDKRRRRSSGVVDFNSHDDDTLTSTVYSSDSEPPDAVEEIISGSEEGSSSDSDDGTMMSIETEEVTGTTVASERSADDGNNSSTLDEALRMAAQHAGTQRLDVNADEDTDDGEEVIPSFGWVKKGERSINKSPEDKSKSDQSRENTTDTGLDMDITRTMGTIFKPAATQAGQHEEEMSMDVTQAFGGILSQSRTPKSRESLSTGDDTALMEDATMDLTTAIGGIRIPQDDDQDSLQNDEDMSMEFTAAMGGIFAQEKAKSIGAERRRTLTRKHDGDQDDATMDMTTGLGRIMSQTNQSNDDTDGDTTVGMDMTSTFGGIVATGPGHQRALGKKIMEEEVNKPSSPKKAIMAAVSQSSPARRSSARLSGQQTGETTSPGLSAFRGKGLRRSGGPQTIGVDSPKGGIISRTPSPEKPSTPKNKPRTSSARKSDSPLKGLAQTPTSASPKRLRSSTASRTPSPKKPKFITTLSGHSNETVSNSVPSTVTTPQPARQLTGVGADRSGLGSPKVAAVFDRRTSIGEAASEFVPGKRTVAFEDPQKMASSVDKERKEEEQKENRRRMLEREADGLQEDGDATFNLREMIDSLSPTKKPAKGRKSLHVGSARGILGKRPMELDDEDDDAEENDGVKGLKGHQSSPVKKVRLQQPPSAAETIGRPPALLAYSLGPISSIATPTHTSPMKNERATTPRNQGRFKEAMDARGNHTVHAMNFHQPNNPKDEGSLEQETDDDRIHLQDFLNMTSIRFMELTTTKRRHTRAPSMFKDGTLAEGHDDMSLERCVVAGACTVPMLELYQHSCRELKNYISEGRRMVQEIELDTFEDNPPLFREYISATPDVKVLMDNQFKNVKTHARHQSKAMWYEWRMKLQDGLKEGLLSIADGMSHDEKHLKEQQEMIASVLPALSTRVESLESEYNNLEDAAQELADCDPEELQNTRNELVTLNEDIAQKKKLIAQLRHEFNESSAHVEELSSQKQQFLADIADSEKTREECRGWNSMEVDELKAQVEEIESRHGWAVTGISGTTLSLSYKREIELVFDVSAFQPHQPNAPIDLWYIANNRDIKPMPKTVEKEFFLQCIRDQVRSLTQSRTVVPELLRMVRTAWDKATMVCSHITRVNVTFPTSVAKTSDSSIAVTTSLLLAPLQTRVEVTLNLQDKSTPEGFGVSISGNAEVVYGEHFNVDKIGEFLATRIGEEIGGLGESWSDIFVELQARLIARGKK